MAEHDPGWIRTCPVAHRGLHDARRPENSLLACAVGAEAGYALELDLHALADDTVVVFHDDGLERMTGVRRPLVSCTREEIAGVRLLGTAESIPTLPEVLALVAGRVPLLLELKGTQPVGLLERAMWKVLAGYAGAFAVQSFDPRSLMWWRAHAPGVLRGQLASGFRRADLPWYQKAVLRRLAMHPWARPHFIGYELASLPYWAPELARRAGLPVLAWTVRSRQQYTRALKFADNVIFEHIRPPVTR